MTQSPPKREEGTMRNCIQKLPQIMQKSPQKCVKCRQKSAQIDPKSCQNRRKATPNHAKVDEKTTSGTWGVSGPLFEDPGVPRGGYPPQPRPPKSMNNEFHLHGNFAIVTPFRDQDRRRARKVSRKTSQTWLLASWEIRPQLFPKMWR